MLKQPIETKTNCLQGPGSEVGFLPLAELIFAQQGLEVYFIPSTGSVFEWHGLEVDFLPSVEFRWVRVGSGLHTLVVRG